MENKMKKQLFLTMLMTLTAFSAQASLKGYLSDLAVAATGTIIGASVSDIVYKKWNGLYPELSRPYYNDRSNLIKLNGGLICALFLLLAEDIKNYTNDKNVIFNGTVALSCAAVLSPALWTIATSRYNQNQEIKHGEQLALEAQQQLAEEEEEEEHFFALLEGGQLPLMKEGL
jgi:hypothetical protein